LIRGKPGGGLSRSLEAINLEKQNLPSLFWDELFSLIDSEFGDSQ
jgi:hypothetical protein